MFVHPSYLHTLTLHTAYCRAVMRGGEALARPGVLSAGKQTSFHEQRDETPSAFESPEESEQRSARLRSVVFLRREGSCLQSDQADLPELRRNRNKVE
jgi:hypothetical protein